MKYKYLILGAGPAGLTFAASLFAKGENSFLVLEREKEAGGLCRSKEVDGAPLDIGGGHFLDVRRTKIVDFLFQYMPESEWNKYKRDSRIEFKDSFISHPFEANIWQMDIDDQVEYLKSIAVAGCNKGEKKPELFTDWITWKLGDKVASDYMIPYNQKMFGDALDELGTYWMNKLPSVSFEDTLRSCLTHHAYGKQPGHAEFYYPKKYGYGEVWLRIAEQIKEHVIYSSVINKIDFNNIEVETIDGEVYQADKIITTIPWNSVNSLKGMPDDLLQEVKKLKHTSIQVEYFNKEISKKHTEAQWLYIPNKRVPYHRILVRYNFCPGSRGFWTETRSERIDKKAEIGGYRYLNEYAYPLNTIDKPEIMSKLLEWAEFHNVYGLGRWGEHCHYNSDATVALALEKFERLYEL